MMDIKKPLVSVIMGIYNCEETLSDAIESIMNQTYKNFEFIICDDGSTDNTYQIACNYLKQYPKNIILIKNEVNKGLNFTLNHCLKYAKGEYIARMDADDQSLPNRFQEQIDFLEKHKDISILGANLKIFDDNGIWASRKFKEYPIQKDFLLTNPFSHSVIMARKDAYDLVSGYSEGKFLIRVEDYHCWIKMYSLGLRGANLQKDLYLYRDDRNSYLKRKFKYRLNEAYVVILAIKMLKLKKYNYIFALKPILVGILPYKFYNYFHKRIWINMNRRRE